MSKSPRTWRAYAARIALVLLATFVLGEVGVRLLMFRPLPPSWLFVYPVRRVGNYGFGLNDTEYWELQHQFSGQVAVPQYDPIVGWTGGIFTPTTYVHSEEQRVGARRPVLLFGDSFSSCLTSSEDCFQGLMERSPLANTHALINYGVGGYGLDQVYLLVKHSIDNWTERKPLILVGLLVDEDLDRCSVGFRMWPKPQFELVEGELSLHAPAPSIAEHFERRGPHLTSYGLRFLRFGAELAPRRSIYEQSAESEVRLQALSKKIFEGIVAELEGRGLDYFFVLFYSREALAHPEFFTWRDKLTRATLDELGAPWVSTGQALLQQAAAENDRVDKFFGGDRKLAGHLNARGNEVAFRAILDGIDGYYGERGRIVEVTPAVFEDVVLRGEQAVARFETGLWGPYQAPEDRERLCFRVGEEGPVQMRYRLDGRARGFRVRARFLPIGEFTPEQGSVGLTLLADGEPVFQRTLRRSDPELPIHIDLEGRDSLTIRVDDAGDGILGDLLLLAGPEFE